MIDISLNTLLIVIAFIAFMVFVSVLYVAIIKTDIQDSTSDYKLEAQYKNQVKLLSDKYEPVASKRRPVTELLNNYNDIHTVQQ